MDDRGLIDVSGKGFIRLFLKQYQRINCVLPRMVISLLFLVSFFGAPAFAESRKGLQSLSESEMEAVSARAGADLSFKINVNSNGSSPSDSLSPGAHFVWRDNDNLITGDSLNACQYSYDCSDAYGIFHGLSGHLFLDTLVVDASSASSQGFLQLTMGSSNNLTGYLQAEAIGLGPGTDPDCNVSGSCGNTVAGNVVLEGPFDITGDMRVWGN